MKRVVALVLIGAMTAGCAVDLSGRGARIVPGQRKWDNVVALPANAVVRVVTSGSTEVGTLISADDIHVRLGTRHGTVVIPAGLVQRVDRLMVLPRSRKQAALGGAAVGAAMAAAFPVLAGVVFCAALGGRPCWFPPKPRMVAGGALFGAAAATVPYGGGTAMTVYVRP